MSRCFPYPPPNFRREEKKSLAESIKLQKERETANESRKDRKKEKKERKERKEKGDRSKDRHEHSKHREHDHKKRKYDDMQQLHSKEQYQKAVTKDSVEHLEKSGITEERGLPFPLQEPCESSESTQNSSKSRKLDIPDISCGSQGGTKIVLRLPLNKQKSPVPAPTTRDPCFTGRPRSRVLEAAPGFLAAPGGIKVNQSSGPTSKYMKSIASVCTASKDLKATFATSTTSDVHNAPPAVQAICKRLKVNPAVQVTSEDLKANLAQATSKGLKVTPAVRGAPSNDLKVTSALLDVSKSLKVTPAVRATSEVQKATLPARPTPDIQTNPDGEKPCISGRHISRCSEVTNAPMDLDLGGGSQKQSIKSGVKPESLLLDHNHSHSGSKSKEGSKTSRKMERKFKDLILNWKPVSLVDADAETEDMGWLFESARQRQPMSSVTQNQGVGYSGEDLAHGCTGSFQPRAHYLPDLQIYQLPYTVPF